MAQGRFRTWIIEHDDSWIFITLYIGLAVVLSISISLFWLLVVVAAHFVLEWLRQRHIRRQGVLAEVLWELKLDIALVLFALTLTLYLDVVFGLLGLQAAGRAGAVARVGVRSGGRFAAWERTLRAILLSIDDMVKIARVVVARRATIASAIVAVVGSRAGAQVETRAGDVHVELDTRASALTEQAADVEVAAGPWGSWAEPWSKGDWVALCLAVACLTLIALAPWLTGHDYASAFATMAKELRPFPGAAAR